MSTINYQLSTEQTQTQRLQLRQQMMARLYDTLNMELPQLVAAKVDENPALEWENDPEAGGDIAREVTVDDIARQESQESIASDDWEPQYYKVERDKNEEYYERPIVSTFSFQDALRQQLIWLHLSENESIIAEYLVDCLDDDGYLTYETNTVPPKKVPFDNLRICGYLLAQNGVQVSQEEVEHTIVHILQTLDPPGVFARNLQECLLIQLRQQKTDSPQELTANAIRLIERHFEDYLKKRFDTIKRKEGWSDAQFAEIQKVILKLNPTPGNRGDTQFVIPDFVVTNENGRLRATLANEYKPRLRVNKDFGFSFENTAAQKKRNAEAIRYCKKYIEDGRLFIDALSERNKSMCLVMNEILNRQYSFFATGNYEMLKPMVLKDVADAVKLDLSTISRITSKRYVQTEFGILLLKNLFTESVSDDDTSSAAVKQCLYEIVAKEDKKSPYSDDKLVELLAKRGYSVARRTVAKYREQMDIPSSRMRKE